MTAFKEWFDKQPPETQDRFHDIARRSPLQLPRCPMDYQILQELLAWQALEIEVLDAHADWLAATKAKFERRGIEWTVENLKRWPRLGEVE